MENSDNEIIITISTCNVFYDLIDLMTYVYFISLYIYNYSKIYDQLLFGYISILMFLILINFYFKSFVKSVYKTMIDMKHYYETMTKLEYKEIHRYSKKFTILNFVMNIIFGLCCIMLTFKHDSLYRKKYYNNEYLMIYYMYVEIHTYFGMLLIVLYGTLAIYYIIKFIKLCIEQLDMRYFNTQIIDDFIFQIVDKRSLEMLEITYSKCPVCSLIITERTDRFIKLQCCEQKYHNSCLALANNECQTCGRILLLNDNV